MAVKVVRLTSQFLQLGIELPTSLELQRTALEKYAGCYDADGVIIFAIESPAGNLVGAISLHSRDEKNGQFSFGVSVDRPYRGRGYAEDAIKIILRYEFWERRYQKCNSACPHTNEASIGLHKKVGFMKEGCRRRRLFFNDEYHDDVLFGTTRKEFDAQQKD